MDSTKNQWTLLGDSQSCKSWACRVPAHFGIECIDSVFLRNTSPELTKQFCSWLLFICDRHISSVFHIVNHSITRSQKWVFAMSDMFFFFRELSYLCLSSGRTFYFFQISLAVKNFLCGNELNFTLCQIKVALTLRFVYNFVPNQNLLSVTTKRKILPVQI